MLAIFVLRVRIILGQPCNNLGDNPLWCRFKCEPAIEKVNIHPRGKSIFTTMAPTTPLPRMGPTTQVPSESQFPVTVNLHVQVLFRCEPAFLSAIVAKARELYLMPGLPSLSLSLTHTHTPHAWSALTHTHTHTHAHTDTHTNTHTHTHRMPGLPSPLSSLFFFITLKPRVE